MFYSESLDCRGLFLILHNLTLTERVRACDLSLRSAPPDGAPLSLYPSSCLSQPVISAVSDPGQHKRVGVWAERAVMCEMILWLHTQQGCQLTKTQKALAQYLQICLHALKGFRGQGITNYRSCGIKCKIHMTVGKEKKHWLQKSSNSEIQTL